MEFSCRPVNIFQDDGLSQEDRMMLDGMRNTAFICGRRGGDVEFVVHQALKRMGRYDLLPPCEREDKHNTFTDKAKIPEIWKQIREDRLADAGYPPLSRDLPAEEKRCMNCGHRFENEDYPGSACFNCQELSNWEG